jgi:hypothetical protein
LIESSFDEGTFLNLYPDFTIAVFNQLPGDGYRFVEGVI